MPTLILIDSSLSMLRPAHRPRDGATNGTEDGAVNGSSPSSNVQLMDLAKWGVDWLLSHLEKSYKMEQVALLSYSSQCDLVVNFTRDIPELRAKVTTIDNFDSTSIRAGLKGMNSYLLEQWGTAVPVHVIIVTDGVISSGPSSLKSLLASKRSLGDPDGIFPVRFGGKLNIVCVNHPDDPSLQETIPLLEQLIERTGLSGYVHVPEVGRPGDALTRASVEKCFQTLIEKYYKTYEGTLQFGQDLSTPITLCPPPVKYREVKDFEVVEAAVEDVIEVKGFFTLADVASPATVSRHLILPSPKGELTPDEESRNPNLCVLVHGALKTGNLCALVQVSRINLFLNFGDDSTQRFYVGCKKIEG